MKQSGSLFCWKVIVRRVEIEAGIALALKNHELCLHFQPIHDTHARVTGFEALARWPFKGHGMVPPNEFIPIAERLGLIDVLTEWVLDCPLPSTTSPSSKP